MEDSKLLPVQVSITVKDAAKALDFYTAAFGAKEIYRLASPEGEIMHAEFTIGSSHFYISGESPEWGALAIPEGQMASSLLCIINNDCDAAYQQAIDTGATSVVEPGDHFFGRRTAVVADPFGYRWALPQILEVLSPEQIKERAAAMFANSEPD